jgi:hypothetical protein
MLNWIFRGSAGKATIVVFFKYECTNRSKIPVHSVVKAEALRGVENTPLDGIDDKSCESS